MFVSTIDNRTKTKLIKKSAQKTRHLHEEKIPLGAKYEGGHLVERGVFSGTYVVILALALPREMVILDIINLICKFILLFFYGIFNILQYPQTNQHVQCAYM